MILHEVVPGPTGRRSGALCAFTLPPALFPAGGLFAGGFLPTSRQLLVVAAKREGGLWIVVFGFDGDPWWACKCRGGRSAAVVGLSKPERLRALWKACNGCNAGGWLLCEE